MQPGLLEEPLDLFEHLATGGGVDPLSASLLAVGAALVGVAMVLAGLGVLGAFGAELRRLAW